jgi:hypothetical protein
VRAEKRLKPGQNWSSIQRRCAHSNSRVAVATGRSISSASASSAFLFSLLHSSFSFCRCAFFTQGCVRRGSLFQTSILIHYYTHNFLFTVGTGIVPPLESVTCSDVFSPQLPLNQPCKPFHSVIHNISFFNIYNNSLLY